MRSLRRDTRGYLVEHEVEEQETEDEIDPADHDQRLERRKGEASPATVAVVPVTAAARTGISVGISSTGSSTSRKRLRTLIAESRVPTLQIATLARATIVAVPAMPDPEVDTEEECEDESPSSPARQ